MHILRSQISVNICAHKQINERISKNPWQQLSLVSQEASVF